ncbi:diacylglycerol O-acyltransferase 1A isoform X1 [Populus trichocarpa]|uniref:O-acyltransferase n=1 Tax=Populus trichocarpa TaxID=3694 RepID=A0A3N7F4F3_POPTR|nr:diacylglycerol O-acyltransferase 1A isoform X1 [Populus trichocarpa]XP_024459883.1 diacylglycerol O-acyltransferase 1A isoform X1 [Populus trichocarpa]|eukprot:XP_024459882.1 diacylglycerol O-acyltransferase 1A isoform X1 [Populus trichocarpa]
MAALESPENHIKATATSTATTSSSTTSDLNFSVRRRSTTVTDSPSTEMMESEDLKSNGKECDKVTNENRSDIKFNYRPSMPAHRGVRESPLSSDAIFKQSHAGLFNLCIVVLVAINSRLIIENIIKYGWLINGGFWFSSKSLRDWPLFMCCLSLPAFPFAAYLVEKLAYQNYLPQLVVVFLHTIITTGSLLYPVLVILRCDSAFLSGVTLMLFSCIVWLKLVSYAHTNSDLRAIAKSIDRVSIFEKAQQEDVPSISPYVGNPYDTYFKSLVYFMVAPTLCYQSSYPRTESVRKGWVVQQFVKLIIFTGFMGFIIEQYINPIVKNSQHPFKGNLLYAIERVLKLSVPNLYVWLCMFYCFFHLWLNILAELLCFGDREFYKDWWNARTVEEYWRMWNMPVHKWMVRHIYFPCLRNKIPKGLAILIAFLVSAVFHELCIAVPCHVFKLWAFIGIMLQVPLVVITKFLQNKFRSSMVGNMIFWLFFSILGQPMCVLLYYHDLMNRKGKTESR